MSRYSAESDLDYYDDLNGPYVTVRCMECGTDFRCAFDDTQAIMICEECADARDAHTDALEARLTEIALTAVKAALASKTSREIA